MKESNATIGINTFWAHWSSLEWLHFIYCHPFNKLCIAGLCILQLDEIWKDILPSWVFQNLRKQHLLLFQTSLCNLMEPLFNDSFYKFSNWPSCIEICNAFNRLNNNGCYNSCLRSLPFSKPPCMFILGKSPCSNILLTSTNCLTIMLFSVYHFYHPLMKILNGSWLKQLTLWTYTL